MGGAKAVLCGVCLLGATLAGSAEGLSHVRGTGSFARWVIDSGVTYSVTVSALAGQLEKTDVVAYVSIASITSGTAKTTMLNGAGPIRYLLITIDNRLTPDVMVEMLGHELQHVLEIAEARDVRDKKGLIALYQRIGLHKGATNQFETLLAQEMGRRARRDMINRPAALYARSSQ
jgi:hypothetical protein